MEKCGNDSAHAGESNASITGPVGLLRTQPPSVLSIHPHHIGFFENFAQTHTRVRFFVKIDPCWKINRNSEKCGKMCIRLSAQGWPEGCRFSILGAFFVFHTQTPDPLGIHSTPCGLASAGFCKKE